MVRVSIKRLLLVLLLLALLLGGCAQENMAQEEPLPLFTPSAGPVSFLGPEGTYTEEAALCLLGAECELLPCKTVADAVQLLLDGQSMYAVIPQENTLGGPVYDYVDELLAHEALAVVGGIELPIRQALLAKPGTALADITVVYSHPQGIIQSTAWLQQHLPQAEVVEVSSTAEGAKMVAQSAGSDCAAIASTGAAKVYGLQVLAESIQQSDANKTRFYLLQAGDPALGAADRLLFAAGGAAEDLPALLDAVAKSGMQPVFVHDRPEKTQLGRYVYLIECANGSAAAYQQVCSVPEFSFRLLGSYYLTIP